MATLETVTWKRTLGWAAVFAAIKAMIPGLLLGVGALYWSNQTYLTTTRRNVIVVTGAVVLYATLILAIRTMRFVSTHVTCAGCGKRFSTRVPWQCGKCDARNDEEASEYNLLGICAKCRAPVAAYECHFCGFENVLDPDWDGRHAARSADKPADNTDYAGLAHEDARAKQRRARELTQDTTLLTIAQTEALQAEIRLIQQSQRLQALKTPAKEEKTDPVAAFGQQLDEAIASSTNTIRTRQQLREMIQTKQAALEASAGFRLLDEDGQRRAKELFAITADRLERSLQRHAKPPSR